MKTLISFWNKLSIDGKSISVLKDAYNQMMNLNPNYLINLSLKYKNDKDSISLEDFKCLEEYSKKLNINIYTLYAIALPVLLIEMENHYKIRNIKQELYEDIIKDYRYKIIECQLVKNVVGIFPLTWYFGILKLEIFGFGRLQFQVCKAGKDIMIENHLIHSNDKVLNIHIPRNGQRLEKELIDQSIESATKFFKDDFEEYIPILCHSWLFHPNTISLLDDNSKIKQFADRFQLIETSETKDISSIWRLFDQEVDINDLSKLNEDTSLRKKFKAYYINGGLYGEALVGMIVKNNHLCE